jgi:hypothetical protein
MPVQPRRVFAPSVVLTVVGSLATASAAPADKPPPVMKNPPPPRKPPEKKPPPPTAPKTDRHWHVYQTGKTCFADNSADSCPPPPKGQPAPPCNPPAPTAYACPQNVALPINVVQRAGATDCFIDYGPPNCPPNVACNPPPPRKLACP